MPKESLNPAGLAEPFGPFALVTRAGPGRLVFLSGAIAIDAEGKVVGAGDIVAQTRQVMENLRIALAGAGGTFADVVKINNYVTDRSEYAKIAPVREEYLREPYPASTLVEVSSLIFPELMIEIEAIAVIADA